MIFLTFLLHFIDYFLECACETRYQPPKAGLKWWKLYKLTSPIRGRKGVLFLRRAFLCGMIGYPALELLYRRRTHPAMALAGGIGLAGLTAVYPLTRRWPLWKAGLLGGAGITLMEYRLGRRFNRRYQIWDYRKLPLNVRGQVCPQFSAVWWGISVAVLGVMRRRDGWM